MAKKKQEKALALTTESMDICQAESPYVADFDAMEAAAREYVKKFDGIEIATEDDRKAAKALKAECNAKIAEINDARIMLDKVYDAPKREFKHKCDGVIAILRDSIAHIENGLIDADANFLLARRELLECEYEEVAPSLVRLIKIDAFLAKEKKLLGRSWPDSKAVSRLDEMVIEASEGYEAIRSLGLEFATDALQVYCKTLDIGQAIECDAELTRRKAQNEAFQKQAEETAAASAAYEVQRKTAAKAPAEEPVKQWTFTFSAPRSAAAAIADFARSLGVQSDGIKEVRR